MSTRPKASPKRKKVTAVQLRRRKPVLKKKRPSVPKGSALWSWFFGAAVTVVCALMIQVTQAPKVRSDNESVVINTTPVVRPPAVTVDPLFLEASRLSIDHRVSYWSEKLQMGWRPAVLGQVALGQVPKIDDQSPLLVDTFDCTTYVETVLALSRSKTPTDFFGQLISIRYQDGKPDYFQRNHFPEADWIPNNVRSGILKESTLFSAQVQKNIDKAEWFKKQGRSLASQVAPVRVSLNYLPIDQLRNGVSKLPNGSVLSVVHENSSRQPVLISHQGLVIQDKGQTLFRHATQQGQIETVPLEKYLEERQRQTRNWKILGVHVAQVNWVE